MNRGWRLVKWGCLGSIAPFWLAVIQTSKLDLLVWKNSSMLIDNQACLLRVKIWKTSKAWDKKNIFDLFQIFFEPIASGVWWSSNEILWSDDQFLSVSTGHEAFVSIVSYKSCNEHDNSSIHNNCNSVFSLVSEGSTAPFDVKVKNEKKILVDSSGR